MDFGNRYTGKLKIVLTDLQCNHLLFPFGEIRSVAHIRIGILTIFEKWNFFFPGRVFIQSEMPGEEIGGNEVYTHPANEVPSYAFLKQFTEGYHTQAAQNMTLEKPWHIFQQNDWALREDYQMLTEKRSSAPLPLTCHSVNSENIFIEEGATLNFAIINATNGPVYIGKHAKIMEGCLLQGPISIGEGAVLKMGTRIYGGTTIGPYCIAGGEIKNSILMAYSNKAHDGYLGDSVVGEWCNFGAGSSNSNIKNTASDVFVWNNAAASLENAGLKCGLLMGSYSRCAINTSFNTGTVIGVCCHLFGNRMPEKFTPSFTWGDKDYDLEKALRDIDNWKKLKSRKIGTPEIEALKKLHKKIE